jgi:hypothetical protein
MGPPPEPEGLLMDCGQSGVSGGRSDGEARHLFHLSSFGALALGPNAAGRSPARYNSSSERVAATEAPEKIAGPRLLAGR